MNTISREWAVLTWNIQGMKRTNLERIADVVASESPDVVALQEVRRPQSQELAERLEMTQCWAQKHNPFRPFFPSWAEGAAILTPHELTSPGDIRISDATSKRSYRRRIVQCATVTRADASGYRIYNTHLSPHDLRAERLAEATRVAEHAAAFGDAPPAIVAGDFNDAGEPEVIATLPGIEVLRAPLTNPASAPTKALDHVLVPATARNVSVSAPAGGEKWSALSDHLPVTVRFSLDWVAGDFVG